MATTLAVLHPKGGVGRSTTVFQLGVELALRGRQVAIEDLDQARHLTVVAQGRCVPGLTLCARGSEDLVILDTAPEADALGIRDFLRRADFVLIPVKGPEEASVQVLPDLLQWIQEAGHARILGFLPTMHKKRRGSTQHWLRELEALAQQHNTRVLAPIADLASLADWEVTGHPYAHVAEEVIRGANI